MATSFTSNTGMAKPGPSDRNWDEPLNANFEFLDGLTAIGSLLVTTTEHPSASLRIRISPGSYEAEGGSIVHTEGIEMLEVPASSATALWIDGAGEVVVGSVFPSTSHLRLARVVTDENRIVSIRDERVVFKVGGLASLPPTNSFSAAAFLGQPLPSQVQAIQPITLATSTVDGSEPIRPVGAVPSSSLLDSNFAILAAKVNQLIHTLGRYGLLESED